MAIWQCMFKVCSSAFHVDLESILFFPRRAADIGSRLWIGARALKDNRMSDNAAAEDHSDMQATLGGSVTDTGIDFFA